MGIRDFPEEGLHARLAMELDGGDGLGFLLQVELRYSPADPLVVHLTFHIPGDAPVTWSIARELLLDGISGRTGEGDIHVRPYPEDEELVQIQLHSPGGSAHLLVGVSPLHAVLLRTDLLVPFGDELLADRLERELELLLESCQPER